MSDNEGIKYTQMIYQGRHTHKGSRTLKLTHKKTHTIILLYSITLSVVAFDTKRHLKQNTGIYIHQL